MPAIETGIIQFENSGQVLSTHFRDELFDDGPIAIAAGNLTISNGFAGSLADALAGGADYGFHISGGANMDIIEGAASILKLALILEKQGKSPGDLFGPGDVEITVKDTVENIQALLAEPGLGLFDKIAAIDLVFEGEPPEIRVPLDQFDPAFDLSMFAGVTVFGTLEDYDENPLNLTTITDPFYTFVVEDTLREYKTGGFTAGTGNLVAVDSGDYRVVDTLPELLVTTAELSGSSFDGLTSTYGVVDTLATVDGAYTTDLVSLGVQSIVLEDSIANLSSAGANLLPGDPLLDGIKAVDSYANLLGSTFADAFLTDATEVIARDTAENIGLNLTLPADGPQAFAGDKQLSGIEVLPTVETLVLTFDDIVQLELSHLLAVDDAAEYLQLQASTAQLTQADADLGTNDSILDRLPTLAGTGLIGVDTAGNVDAFLDTIPGLETEVASALAGFNLKEDLVGGSNTLTIDAAAVSDDAAVNPYTPYTGFPLRFDAIDGGTLVEMVGTAAVISDGDYFYPSNYVNTDPAALGGAFIEVRDSASNIRTAEVTLAGRDSDGGDTSFTVDGFLTDIFHEVGTGDIAAPLASFTYATDWYDLDVGVFTAGNSIEIGTAAGGDFEVSDTGGSDVIDISEQTLVFDDFETNPAFDFAFVGPLQLGSRTETVDGKPAIDISVEPGSTLIEFDGLAAGYDAIADFSITINDVNLVGEIDILDDDGDLDDTDIKNGITVMSFFGIPFIDQVLYDVIDPPSAVVPDLDLLRFEAVDAYASAFQAFNHLETHFYGSSSRRQDEVDTLFNVEGDVLLGDNNGDGPQADDTLNGDALGALADDVIFGLEGNDTINGLSGDDRIHGGDGDDTVMGGEGNDYIEDKWGINTLYGNAGEDYIVGGDQTDVIHGGDDDDTIGGKFGDDVIYGDAGGDYIDGEGGEDDIHGGLGNDTLYGGDDNDEIFGDEGDDGIWGDAGADDLFGGDGADTIRGGDDDDELFGQDGNDTLYGNNQNDELYGEDGNDTLYGGNGNDDLFGGADNDTLNGDDENDNLYGGQGLDNLYGGYGYDNLYGGDDDDMLYGGPDDDMLDGGAGVDILNANEGDDTLVGGLDGDTLDGGSGEDTADYSAATVDINVDLLAGTATGGDTLSLIENVTGGTAGDNITGSAGDNVLIGNGGNDNISGEGGRDDIQGGMGMDTIDGGDGGDTINGGADADTIDGGAGNDTIRGGDGADDLTGGSGQDVFTIAAASEFGDIIRDFVTTTNPDSMELGRGALTGVAALPDYGTSAGLLTSEALYFALQNDTTITTASGYGHAFSSDGGFAQVHPDGPSSEQQLPVLTQLGFGSLIRTNSLQDFTDFFKNELVGLYAPTKVTINTPNPAAFTTTPSGDINLITGLPTTVSTFLQTSVSAKYIAFGMVRDTSGESLVETAALVMAVINNGPAGANDAGFNEITAGEISVYTVAIFNPTDDAVSPQYPTTGDIFLV